MKELAKEHDIRYDPASPIPTDRTLMRSAFEAGFELLLDVGVLCIDTERIIRFTEDEIREALRTLRGELTFGEGRDTYVSRHRELEDPRPPTVHYGPGCSPISEEFAYRIYLSYTKEPMIDSLYTGTLETLYGMPVKPGSPWEMQAEVENVALMRKACSAAGRPGMAITGTASVTAAADVGASSSEYGYIGHEGREAKLKPQLKVDYDNLCRVANYVTYGGQGSNASGNAYIYGLAGGPETAVCVAVATSLAGVALLGVNQMTAFAYNTSYTGTTDRVSIWASSLAQAAYSTNTRAVVRGSSPYISYSGPGTSMSLYEIAAVALARTAVGCNLGSGCGGRQGKHLNYCSGLEGRWAAEIGHASAGTRLEDINELVNALLARYEDVIEARSPPAGKTFDQLYDGERVMPSREYMELYVRTRKELEDLGVDFERLHP